MGLLVEYRLLDKLQVINEGIGASKKLKLRGKFQKCDEQNNNGRIYPRKVLEPQVKEIQAKIDERSLVGALDHPPNDAIHLSQASHLITKLWVENNGDVMGEAEILSTPSGKIVEALLNDNVKIGISSRGLGTISEGKEGKIVNEDFKLITFDLVSDPSTKGAYPSLTESVKLNSAKAQKIVSRMKAEKILLTALESKINEKLRKVKEAKGKDEDDGFDAYRDRFTLGTGRPKPYLPKKDKEEEKQEPKKDTTTVVKKIGMKKKSKKTSDTAGQKKFGFMEESIKKLVSPTKKPKVLESLQRLEEGSGTSKDINTIKKYLVDHLQDLWWARPFESPTTGEVWTPEKEAKNKLDFLERIIKVIKEL